MTTLRDYLRDFAIEIRNSAQSQEGLSDEHVEEKVEDFLDYIKERLLG